MICLTPHCEKLNDLLSGLGTDMAKGLSEEEAEKRLSQYGENKLKEKKKKSFLARFFEQFKDVMILILIAAALVSFATAIYEGEGFFEPVLILLIVILNAFIGVIQENKAEKALDALKSLSAPNAKVIRNGTAGVIEASKLVPGDIILLEAGDFVPSDARLIESASLKVEESALTGESVPAEKDALAEVAENAPLGDRHNMVYSGCSVAYGRAKAVVTATGMDTEIGKIANLLAEEPKEQTPLQQRLAALG
ncbi:MAG TPA: HAD-IC family P-type ATPase, partial [Oscillospiraceae bacterium]|nr:HAD-IC family P-type ATPase [Oscillospiraceae bacterium]